MKKLLILCAALVAGACTADEAQVEADRSRTQATLAAELADYESSGPPVSCVSSRDLQGNHSVGDAVVFEGTGGRLWVNSPAGGCPDLGMGRALMVRSTGSQLCRGDIATVVDMSSRTTYGGCGLGDFQPYRRRPR
jgi:hypothetical protein